MQKMKPLGKGSFLRSVLRKLGMGEGCASSSLPNAQTKPSDSSNYVGNDFTRTASLEAERVKAKAIMETRRTVQNSLCLA